MLRILILSIFLCGLSAHATTLVCKSADAAAPGVGFSGTIENEKLSGITLDTDRAVGDLRLDADSSFSMDKNSLSLHASEVCEFEAGSCLRIKVSARKTGDSLYYYGKMKMIVRDSLFKVREGKISVNTECYLEH